MSAATTKHDPYAVFRFQSYRDFFWGMFLSQIGMRIQTIAVGWEVYERTGEALALGLVGLVQVVPVIALALPAGFLADRYPRKTILMFSLVGMTLASICLAIVSAMDGNILLMYILLLVDASMFSLGRPARMALLPQLVPKRLFSNAVTWNQSIFQVSMVVGPAIGGYVILIHPTSSYWLCALSSVVFFILSLRIRVMGQPCTEGVDEDANKSFFSGPKFVFTTPLLLASLSLDMFAVLLGGAVFLLLIFAKDILGVGVTGLGWLNTAPAIGALFTTFFIAHASPMRHAGRNMLVAVAGFGGATIIFGLSQSFWLSMAMLVLTGVFDTVGVVVRHTIVQLATPDRMRGRVSAINSVFISVSNELGGFESGLVAHFFGPVISVVSGGVGTIVVVLVAAIKSSSLRRLGSLQDVKPATENEGMDGTVRKSTG